MANLNPETAKQIFTPESLRSAAKQSQGCLGVPVSLHRAIKGYLRDQAEPYMKRKVLRLSESFSEIKEVNLMLTANTSAELVEDLFKSMERSSRWKIKSTVGDIGFKYADDEIIAYVASRMPAVYSACNSSKKVTWFFSSYGLGFRRWAMREVWPKSVEKVNLLEPS